MKILKNEKREGHEEQDIIFESLFGIDEDFYLELYSPTPPCLREAKLLCKLHDPMLLF